MLIESSILLIAFFLMLIVSNIINRLYPKIPLPFIQIVLGILVGVLARESTLTLNSELFLALVIGPLNFCEGQESYVMTFVKYKSILAYLILPTVFITMLTVGYVTGKLLPVDIPLAASFALGAALAPTDAVAFLSIAKRFKFPKRVESILTLEGLLNDASGLISFEFAVAALMTGTFSLLTASFSLFWAIIGGILVGILFALLNRGVLSFLEKIDIADVTGALLLELSLPIVSYFVASLFGVSGIIAVVIAGLSQARRFKRIRLFDVELDRVSQIIWETVSFMLNGLVFTVFGYELTRIVEPALVNPLVNNYRLLAIVLTVTVLLFLVRFVMISLYYAFHYRTMVRSLRAAIREILLLTFSGVKGTVSMATILLLPQFNAYAYSLILFTVAAVTLLSFVTGLVVLPYLAQSSDGEEKTDYLTQIAILHEVVQTLEDDLKNTKDEDKGALYAAIDNYNSRIKHLVLEQEPTSVKRELVYLRLMILGIESDGLEHAFSEGRIELVEYRLYQRYLQNLERQINRGFISTFTYFFTISMRGIRRLIRESLSLWPTLRRFLSGQPREIRLTEENRERLTELYLSNTELVLEGLQDLEGVYNSDLIAFMKRSRLQEVEIIETGVFVERVIAHMRSDNIDEMLRGYYLERKVIAEYESRGDITPSYATFLRRNVNKLESYSLKDDLAEPYNHVIIQ